MTENVLLTRAARRRVLRRPLASHVAAGVLARVCVTLGPWLATCSAHSPGVLRYVHIQGQLRRLAMFPDVEWRLLKNGDLMALRKSAEHACEVGTPEHWYQMKVAELVAIVTQRVFSDTGISLHREALAFLSELNIAPAGPMAPPVQPDTGR
jgi:hypothetical protein